MLKFFKIEEIAVNALEARNKEKQLQKLAKYIQRHGHRSMVSRGKLFGELVFSKENDSTIYFKWEEINPTLQSVRDWLGY